MGGGIAQVQGSQRSQQGSYKHFGLFWGNFDQVLWTCPKLPDHEVVCLRHRRSRAIYKTKHSPRQRSNTPVTTVSWLEHRSTFSLTSNRVSMSNLPSFRDPWAKREAWRKSSVFSNRIMFRNLFPGFGIAVVAFTAYVIADNIYLKAQSSDSHHHWQGIFSTYTSLLNSSATVFLTNYFT